MKQNEHGTVFKHRIYEKLRAAGIDYAEVITYPIINESLSIFTFVETSGQIKARVWLETQKRWQQVYTQPTDPCSVHAACGPFTICTNTNANLSCDRMRGFSVKSPAEWDLDEFLPRPGVVTLAYDHVCMNVADADDYSQ
jgi:hypothetical protein